MGNTKKIKKVLVTGTDGYLGAVLVPVLEKAGYEVTGLDTGYYREGWLYEDSSFGSLPRTINKDMRDLTVEDLEGFEAVVAMAELSNDPVGDLVGPVTKKINHLGSKHVAETAKKAGIRRFVYMSSCSVYGVADGTVTEESPVNPQTAYGECKYLTEQELWKLRDENFHPVAMRNATAFGASPRQRFDIVVNNLSGLAYTTGKISMLSDGSPWRPLVHALDIAQAIKLALEAPEEKISGEVFNVGSNSNNYRVREIAEIIAEVFTGCKLEFGAPSADNRSYRVDFSKIEEVLGFKAEWNVRDGAEQLKKVFEKISLNEELFNSRGHTRLKMIQHLLETGQVDEELYWKKAI